jgi:hypothetical protein
MTGSSTEQTSMTDGQRGWNRQPEGGSRGEGTSPVRIISSRSMSGWEGSAADIRAFV